LQLLKFFKKYGEEMSLTGSRQCPERLVLNSPMAGWSQIKLTISQALKLKQSNNDIRLLSYDALTLIESLEFLPSYNEIYIIFPCCAKN
jgi:hypothetical protein